jgi:formyltetrahydrofolate deformylase
MPKEGILRVHGPDQKGIVAAFSQVLYGHGCGIVDAEQSTDHSADMFFQRIHFDYSKQHTDRISLENGIREVCDRLSMTSELNWNDRRKKIAILVSRYEHCLWEILLRHRAGELDCEVSCILSNHPDLKPIADAFGIPFHVFHITKDTRAEEEPRMLHELQKTYDVDLVVLARYMQIVSDAFCRAFSNRVINIHHSFLPAFVGARPYHRAFERGVKLIGATAHYATAVLDEGPIIAQDISRISHRDEVGDLVQKGRILEKNTLVQAVQAHLDDRIIVYQNKCVVFGD